MGHDMDAAGRRRKGSQGRSAEDIRRKSPIEVFSSTSDLVLLQGSLFWDIREKRRSGEGWKQGWGLGGDGFIGYRKRIGIHL